MKIELTIEQKFKLQVYQQQVKSATPEDCKVWLIELIRQNMIKDNLIKELMTNE